jgi:hypothetical protein
MVNRNVYLDDSAGQLKGAASTLTINGVAFTGAADIGDGGVRPILNGWKYWTHDPMCNFQGTTYAAGFVVLGLIDVPQADTVNNVILDIFSAGSGMTNAYVAVYQGGSRLAVSADIKASLTSTGVKTLALSSPATLAKGLAYAAFLGVGGTQPSLARGIGTSVSTQAAGFNRGGYESAGSRTTMPTTIGALTTGQPPWAALS